MNRGEMKIRLIICFLIIIPALIAISGCASVPKSFKETTLDDMYPILTEGQYQTLDSLSNDEEIKRFLDKFWEDIDSTSGVSGKEFKTEYLRRLEYANEHFPDHQGWGRSDQKRIYLIYGPPCYVERTECTGISLGSSSIIRSMEIWTYSTPSKNHSLPSYSDDIYPGEKKFIFVDLIGCGIYQILYSSENDVDIDPRTFK
jgi:GWxTD domain-containing protein